MIPLETSVIIIILVLALVVGAVWLWQWLMSKAASGVNRMVHRKSHKDGQEAAGNTHIITSAKIAPQQILDELWRVLPYPEDGKRAVLAAAIYKEGGSGMPALRLNYGHKLNTFWIVVLGKMDNGGILYAVENATMNDGLVVGAKDLINLQGQVFAAVKDMDPEVKIETQHEQVDWR